MLENVIVAGELTIDRKFVILKRPFVIVVRREVT